MLVLNLHVIFHGYLEASSFQNIFIENDQTFSGYFHQITTIIHSLRFLAIIINFQINSIQYLQ
jgi:hypothetical protein